MEAKERFVAKRKQTDLLPHEKRLVFSVKLISVGWKITSPLWWIR
jgi:hypothetical protein